MFSIFFNYSALSTWIIFFLIPILLVKAELPDRVHSVRNVNFVRHIFKSFRWLSWLPVELESLDPLTPKSLVSLPSERKPWKFPERQCCLVIGSIIEHHRPLLLWELLWRSWSKSCFILQSDLNSFRYRFRNFNTLWELHKMLYYQNWYLAGTFECQNL